MLRLFLKNLFYELELCKWDLRLVPRDNMVRMINPMRILVRLVLKLKVYKNNLQILFHPICNRLYQTKHTHKNIGKAYVFEDSLKKGHILTEKYIHKKQSRAIGIHNKGGPKTWRAGLVLHLLNWEKRGFEKQKHAHVRKFRIAHSSKKYRVTWKIDVIMGIHTEYILTTDVIISKHAEHCRNNTNTYFITLIPQCIFALVRHFSQ